MGSWWSGQRSAHSSTARENEQLNQLQPVNVSIDLRALNAYDDYIKGLSSLNMYTSTFTFSHYDANGLTKDEFHDLMGEFKVPSKKRYGDQAKFVFVLHAEEGTIKKSMLIFVRSRGKYDVVVAEVTMQGELNKTR